MQRSFTYKEALVALLALLLLLIYESISSILYLLPPLLGAAFYLFCDFADRKLYFRLIPIIVFLLVLEADKGLVFGSTIIFFMLGYFFIVPSLKNLISSQSMYKISLIFVAYIGYFSFLSVAELFVKEELFTFSWIIIYYALLESMLGYFLL